MITQVFPATKSKILGKYGRLLRNNNWTSNGYLAFMSAYEPEWMAELKSTADVSPDIEKVVTEYSSKELHKMYITNDLELAGNRVYIKLKSTEEPHIVKWVDANYLSFFIRMKYTLHFYSSIEENVIIVKFGDTVIGIIMGVEHD